MSGQSKIKHPIAIQWNIAETRLQEKKYSIDGFFKCDPFVIPGTDVQYYLKIFPNGEVEERRGQTWIFFYLDTKNDKEIEATYTISNESSSFSKTATTVFKQLQGWGYKLCNTEELFDPEQGFIADDFLIIKLDAILMIEKNTPVKVCEFGSDADSLCLKLWSQENKDFTIVAVGKEIKAHKCILSTLSPVFTAMFRPHTQEAQENKVVIPDFSFEIVEMAIKLCYHHSLVGEISLENQLLLLQFFDKYDIRTLKDKLETFLLLIVDESNVCKLTNSCITSNALQLRKKCSEFLRDCLKKSNAINDFDILDREFAMDLLKNAFRKSCY